MEMMDLSFPYGVKIMETCGRRICLAWEFYLSLCHQSINASLSDVGMGPLPH